MNQRAPMENGTVILRRTFNQPMPVNMAANADPAHFARNAGRLWEPSIRYWRVTGPRTHRNFGSDLSLQGLKDWGIVWRG